MSLKDCCYWCGAPATSREHAPPRCIFPSPKDVLGEVRYRDNLITVPSCDTHNLQKSREDEYLMVVMALHADNNEVGVLQGTSKAGRALQRSKGLQRTVLGKAKQISLVSSTGAAQESATIEIDAKRLQKAYEHIARALYYHHKQKPWDGSVSVNIEFTVKQDSEIINLDDHPRQLIRDKADSLFRRCDKHGANQRVFYYQILDLVEEMPMALVRLTFYGGTRVTTIFQPRKSGHIDKG